MKPQIYKHLLTVSALLTCAFLSTSCKDDDVDSEQSFKKEMAKVEEAYAKTFESIFGKIDPNQSWDFSNIGASGTRAGSVTSYPFYSISSGYYEVGTAASAWLDENLVEAKDNRSKGEPLSFVMPQDGIIDLIPYYQGWSVSAWDMHMMIKPTKGTAEPIDINFWTKNQNIEVKKKQITWNENAVRIKNNKDGKYLRILPTGINLYSNCHSFTVGAAPGSTDWHDQMYMKLNGNLEKGSTYFLNLRYQVSEDTHISLDFHTDVASNEGEKANNSPTNLKVWFGEDDQHLYDETSTLVSGNTITLKKHKGWEYMRIQFTVNSNLADRNFNHIAFSLSTSADDKNNSIEYKFTDYYFRKDGNWNPILSNDVFKQTRFNGDWDNPDFSKTDIPWGSKLIWQTNTISLYNEKSYNGSWAFAAGDDHTDNPYTASKEAGYRFSVITISNSDNTAKYLYAYRDDPANGGFLTIIDGALKLKELSKVNNISEITPVRSYEAPYADKYLMLGEYLLYDNGEGVYAISINDSKFRPAGYTGHTDNNPWNMTDEGRAIIADKKNGYQWTFESENAYDAEKKAIGCDGGGTAISGFTTNIYSKFGGANEVWMPVEDDYFENTVGKSIRAKHYEFNFSKLLEDNPDYKDAIISFYWETLTPLYRRNDATGRYLYSDLGGNEQMYAMTQAIAPQVEGFDQVVVVGCEAGNLRGTITDDKGQTKPDTDYDYNDVVFLLATNTPPTYTDRQGSDLVIEKRYMVEDLGNSDDIDFNDMVVDVRQVTPVTETVNDKNGQVTSTTYGETRQEVIVRAVGGTLPFKCYIGDKLIFSKSQLKFNGSSVDETKMYNTGCGNGSSSAQSTDGVGSHSSDIDYSANMGTFNITSMYGNIWSPSENNIKFEVIHGSSNDGVTDAYKVTTITFPQLGEVPHILAFEVPFYWRNERRLCCWDWILKREPALWVVPESIDYDGTDYSFSAPSGATSTSHTQTFKTWYENTGSSDYLDWINRNFGGNAKTGMDNWLKNYYIFR